MLLIFWLLALAGGQSSAPPVKYVYRKEADHFGHNVHDPFLSFFFCVYVTHGQPFPNDGLTNPRSSAVSYCCLHCESKAILEASIVESSATVESWRPFSFLLSDQSSCHSIHCQIIEASSSNISACDWLRNLCDLYIQDQPLTPLIMPKEEDGGRSSKEKPLPLVCSMEMTVDSVTTPPNQTAAHHIHRPTLAFRKARHGKTQHIVSTNKRQRL